MGIAASIVSAVLKSIVGDKLGSGLTKDIAGLSIGGISEKGINEITNFINDRKLKIESILSMENMKSMGIPEKSIDYVVAEIKELFSEIDITDEALRQCKYNGMDVSAFLWNEYCGIKNGYMDCEKEIKGSLFVASNVLIELVRESEDFEKDILVHISNSVDDTNIGLQKISEYMKDNFNKLDVNNRTVLEILQMILEQNQQAGTKNDKKQNTERTQEYADKWEENKAKKLEKLLYDLQMMSIGCNKKWMNSAFGTSIFTNTDGITNEEVYITDIAIIRAFFKIDGNSCVMFFITQTTEKTIPFMPTLRNTFYNTMGKEKELGTLSYDEIKHLGYKLFIAYGFFTNGSGRTFYGEGYDPFFYYLYPTYYASLDYGVNNPWNMMGYIFNPDFIENEISCYESLDMDNKINGYKRFLSHRKDHYPNTYGVSSLDSAYTFDKLMDYTTFDSLQIASR